MPRKVVHTIPRAFSTRGTISPSFPIINHPARLNQESAFPMTTIDTHTPTYTHPNPGLSSNEDVMAIEGSLDLSTIMSMLMLSNEQDTSLQWGHDISQVYNAPSDVRHWSGSFPTPSTSDPFTQSFNNLVDLQPVSSQPIHISGTPDYWSEILTSRPNVKHVYKANKLSTQANERASAARRKRPQRFFCKFCGSGFTAQHNLWLHIKAHKKQRPEACGICTKSFTTKGVRDRHQLTHSAQGSKER